ncbi:unnamed protein product [Merluccius merluccius]
MVSTAALGIGIRSPMSPPDRESVFEVMLKYLFPSNQKGNLAGRRGSVESCDEMEKNAPISDVDAGPEDEEERRLQLSLAAQMERCLSEAKRSALRCQVLLLPRRMTARVARDVVRASAGEPCGLRGASITVYLEEDEDHDHHKDGPFLKPLGVIRPDPSVTPTFELSVVFRASADGWSPLKHIFVTEEVLKLRPQYRLVKRKLYSSESPVIYYY